MRCWGKTGRELGKKTWINERDTYKRAREMMELLSLDIDVKSQVQTLGIGAQFFTEICRCLLGNARIVILDEPPSAMTPIEYSYFLRAIKKLREQHISVIYISHRLDEIKDICDRVTILRDGKNVRTAEVKDITIPEIIHEMVGKDASGYLQRQQGADLAKAPVMMKLDHVSSGKIEDISFELKAGEILGVTGLLGAGKTELANVIFGVDRKTKGIITVDGKECTFKNPRQAMKAGIPIAVVLRDIPSKKDLYATFSGTDDIELGELGAKGLLDAIGESGKIVYIQGTPGLSTAEDRTSGFHNIIDQYDGIEIVAEQAGGVVQAIDAAGRTGKIKVGGANLQSDAYQRLPDGT